MCLEPLGATGLFILGRGELLLLLGVVIEKEEEDKGPGTLEKEPRVCSHGSQEPALTHFIIRSLTRHQARPEKERQDRETGSEHFPELRLPHSS